MTANAALETLVPVRELFEHERRGSPERGQIEKCVGNCARRLENRKNKY